MVSFYTHLISFHLHKAHLFWFSFGQALTLSLVYRPTTIHNCTTYRQHRKLKFGVHAYFNPPPLAISMASLEVALTILKTEKR